MTDSERGVIVVRIVGGLGNQMFQYACGRALALRNDCELLLDKSAFEKYKLHRYGLNDFCIDAATAPRRFQTSSLFQAAIRRFGFGQHLQMALQGLAFIKEKDDIAFQPRLLRRAANAYLDGYWQDERYFRDVAEIIRSEFQLKGHLTQSGKCILGADDLPRVSLHIRRGDYVYNPKAHSVHGVLKLKYYQEAVRMLSNRIGERFRIVVFSDDIEWARENLNFSQPLTFVSGSNVKPHEDLNTMASCDHHIIANSSFSWWGAWLNPSKSKIVIAPKRWFAGAELAHRNICPTSWVQI